MRFSAQLRLETDGLWRRIHSHPFILGLRDGSLPVAKFRFYMAQDYAYLKDYSRLLALACARSHDLETMGRFADLLNATLNTEMSLHRQYAARFGLEADELEATQMAPAAFAYTGRLLVVAESGSIGEIAAALLPCQYGYWELGQALAAAGAPASQPLYADWVAAYSSREFGELAEWARDLLDREADAVRESERARMAQLYRQSVRFELMFWDMAWNEEAWPGD